MYIGKIVSFFHGTNNGFISYVDDESNRNKIVFTQQYSSAFMPDIRTQKGRSWKYGDIVEFEIDAKETGKTRAIITKFIGNPALEDLIERQGDNRVIDGYFYRHETKGCCTFREKTTRIEFIIKNVQADHGWQYPEDGTKMQAIVRKWDTLTCVIDEPERDHTYDAQVEELKSRGEINAIVTNILKDRILISIENFPETGTVYTRDIEEDFTIGQPIHVRIKRVKTLMFEII